MARRKADPHNLQGALDKLNQLVPEDLCVPSLRGAPPAVRGHAYRFFLVVPLYNAEGESVFTPEHVGHLHRAFERRFGGFLASSSRSGAPFFGEYLPEGAEPVRDYHTIIIVYANPTEPSDRFFQALKEILKKAPLVEQEEILIERSEVYLV